MPSLNLADQQRLQQLQRHGVATMGLADWQLEHTDAMWQAAQAIVPSLPVTTNLQADDENDFGGHCVHADAAKFVTDFPEILVWGLNERLLDLIERYMKCPPALVGVAMRKDSPNGQQIGTRRWHIDKEDQYVIKVMVYLNDVARQTGPFEYVPKDRFNPKYRFLSRCFVRFRQGYNKNQGFEKLVHPKYWQPIVGPAGTAILTDTAAVFHHGAIAEQGERLVLIFAYTTQQPQHKELCKKFFPRADLLPSLLPHLSLRQQTALMGWRE
ncbi:MAG: hypothetical protein HC805_00350 [Alkalinema sp. RL_2_19]|nr:hypothetical protein [Alkalinema sp. RL_2_19]